MSDSALWITSRRVAAFLPVCGLMDLICGGHPFTSRRARELGVSSPQLKGLLKSRRVRRLLHDVYVDARVPEDVGVRCQAVSIVLPNDTVVCRRTAAWLHGVDLFGPAGEMESLTVEVMTADPSWRVRRRGVKGYVGNLDMRDTGVLHGIPVTSPVGTAVDLARWLRRPHALAAIDAMAHAGLVTPAQMSQFADKFPKHRWIGQARELISVVEPKTESPGESWVRLRIIDAGLPIPRAQIPIIEDGREIYRLDLGYPHLRVGLEYDGAEFHESPEQRARDEARREDLKRRFRWDVYPFTRKDVWGDEATIERLVGKLVGKDPYLPRQW